MTFTRSIIAVADADPGRLALAGDGERVSYGDLRDACTRIRSGIELLLEGAAPGRTDAETGGVPIVAVSLSRAIDVARWISGVTSFRAIVAVLDPLWPEEHRLETIRRVDPALVVTDDAGFEAALGALARRTDRAALGRAGRARVERGFSVEKMARAYQDLYAEVLHDHR